MTAAQLDLNPWLTRMRKVQSRSELMAILDEFRPLEWTDEQRSAVSRLYMRLLDSLAVEEVPDEDAAVAAKPKASENDGPVWYEKM